jgi:hypothetical protein
VMGGKNEKFFDSCRFRVALTLTLTLTLTLNRLAVSPVC